MDQLDPIDKFLKQWAIKHGHNIEEIVDACGWPTDYDYGPYGEELQFAINNGEEVLGFALPPEIVAYKLSKWAGTNVPTTHPLVVDCEKWLNVACDIDYNLASPEDVKKLHSLMLDVAGPELLENLHSQEEIDAQMASPDITGHLYTLVISGIVYYMVSNDDVVAFMNQDGQIKAFDYEGNRLYKDEELPKVQNYIVGGMKMSKPITDENELASLIGNRLASLVTGSDGISILDLP